MLDPAGAGATTLRTAVTRKIMQECISRSPRTCVIKGNAGEIGYLSGIGGEVRGVDSGAATDGERAVSSLASGLGCIVASTGRTDRVSDGNRTLTSSRGTPMESAVSGTGCMVSSVVGCFVGACGVSADSVMAGIEAFNIAAEK